MRPRISEAPIPLPSLIRSRRALLYLLVACCAILIENQDEILKGLGWGECDRITLPVRMLYQRFATVSHTMRSHRVWIVSYSERDFPSIANPCSKRAFTAAIITRLAQFSPSVIAVDHWYSPDRCNLGKEDPERSGELTAAIRTVSTTTRIVIGADSDSWEELSEDELSALRQRGFSPGDQIVNPPEPTLAPTEFNSDNVRSALVRLNCDNRRIPLLWHVYLDRKHIPNNAVMATSLALETARIDQSTLTPALNSRVRSRQYPSSIGEGESSSLKNGSSIDRLIADRQHPFTGFMGESEFSPLRDGQLLTASALLCGSNVQGTALAMKDWSHCNGAKPEDLAKLRSTVIVIGQNIDSDQHKSVLGTVPGYLLHANYIDALLSDFYFRPLNPWAELGLTLLAVFSLAAVFELAGPLWKRFLIALSTLLFIIVACNLVEMYFHLFLGFWLALVPVPFFEALFYLRGSTKPSYLTPSLHVGGSFDPRSGML